MMSKRNEREQRLAYEKSVDTSRSIAPVPDVSCCGCGSVRQSSSAVPDPELCFETQQK
jgi:hypothetical protein